MRDDATNRNALPHHSTFCTGQPLPAGHPTRGGSGCGVLCPEGCLNVKGNVWGSDTYRDESSICRAAIHAGRLTNDGGRVMVEKKPGKSSYEESTRNGVRTRSHGEWSGSFVFMLLSDIQIIIESTSNLPATEITLETRPPTVSAPCSMAAKQLPAPITEVICPKECLNEKGNVWGSNIYTDESSICRAAIHAGRLTNDGGSVIVEKTSGQSSYEDSTRNGIKTRNHGEWSGSFIFSSSSSFEIVTDILSAYKTPRVSAHCSLKAKDLPSPITEVVCPAGCLTETSTVWGTGTYSDDSSICRAAIHAGEMTNAGGRIIVEIKPGKISYKKSTQNGITSNNFSAWSVPFELSSSSSFEVEANPSSGSSFTYTI
ncbi:hypothetical protein FKM82_017704, partial [Ascaphus truei]